MPILPQNPTRLRIMGAGFFSRCRLHMPWGAKKQSLETKLYEVSAHLCYAITHWHSCVQKLQSIPMIVPETTFAKNFKDPKVDEVRWSVHVLRRSLWHPFGLSNWLKFYWWLCNCARFVEFRVWMLHDDWSNQIIRMYWNLNKRSRSGKIDSPISWWYSWTT